jgi:hypothetical protein
LKAGLLALPCQYLMWQRIQYVAGAAATNSKLLPKQSAALICHASKGSLALNGCWLIRMPAWRHAVF